MRNANTVLSLLLVIMTTEAAQADSWSDFTKLFSVFRRGSQSAPVAAPIANSQSTAAASDSGLEMRVLPTGSREVTPNASGQTSLGLPPTSRGVRITESDGTQVLRTAPPGSAGSNSVGSNNSQAASSPISRLDMPEADKAFDILARFDRGMIRRSVAVAELEALVTPMNNFDQQVFFRGVFSRVYNKVSQLGSQLALDISLLLDLVEEKEPIALVDAIKIDWTRKNELLVFHRQAGERLFDLAMKDSSFREQLTKLAEADQKLVVSCLMEWDEDGSMVKDYIPAQGEVEFLRDLLNVFGVKNLNVNGAAQALVSILAERGNMSILFKLATHAQVNNGHAITKRDAFDNAVVNFAVSTIVDNLESPTMQHLLHVEFEKSVKNVKQPEAQIVQLPTSAATRILMERILNSRSVLMEQDLLNIVHATGGAFEAAAAVVMMLVKNPDKLSLTTLNNGLRLLHFAYNHMSEKGIMGAGRVNFDAQVTKLMSMKTVGKVSYIHPLQDFMEKFRRSQAFGVEAVLAAYTDPEQAQQMQCLEMFPGLRQ